jgi:hypothetical protein
MRAGGRAVHVVLGAAERGATLTAHGVDDAAVARPHAYLMSG